MPDSNFQHDIVTAQMSPMQRIKMYRLADIMVSTLVAHGGGEDVRITAVACLRVLSRVMASNAWGREQSTIDQIAMLLPLYVQADIQTGDRSRIIQPFTEKGLKGI
jgi:hypothetical protein